MSNSIAISLANMVDLALCSPEIGAVNFNILRSLLHVMLQKLKINNTNVELSGSDYDHIQAALNTRVQKVKEDSRRKKPYKSEEKIAEQKKLTEAKIHSDTELDANAIELQNLEKKMSNLETKLSELEQLPANEDLIKQSRSGSAPITDMWQQLNLTKRMDAAEDGIHKLSSVVEDLAKDTSSLQMLVVEKERSLSKGLDIEGEQIKLIKPSTSGQSRVTIDQIVFSMRDDLNTVRKDVDKIIDDIHHVTELTEKVPFGTLYNSVKEIDELKLKLEEVIVRLSEKSTDQENQEPQTETEIARVGHLPELEEKLNRYVDQVHGLDSNFSSQIEILQEQIGALECDLGRVMEQMNTGQPGGDAQAQDYAGLGELYNRIQLIQSDMEHVNQIATKLMDDEEERQMHIEALKEQMEVLKMVKADRELIEDALAEKADQAVVNRKVSHDQFDTACDGLARGLDEAFTKLCNQEAIWQNALNDVQNEIEQKLDKIELTPLRDFIQQRLKVLQEKLKALAARKEQEAAGSKKFLRDVNCISCDKDVVMRRELESSNVPVQPPLPPPRSIRPYLTYELDKLRQQQKRPLGKNLIQLEDMQQDHDKLKRKARSPPFEKEPEHLVNRYCGGSHTVTAPHQRVIRVGHHPMQFSPETLGFTEITITGTDGQMYRGHELPQNLQKLTADISETTQTSETLLKLSTKEAATKEMSASVETESQMEDKQRSRTQEQITKLSKAQQRESKDKGNKSGLPPQTSRDSYIFKISTISKTSEVGSKDEATPVPDAAESPIARSSKMEQVSSPKTSENLEVSGASTSRTSKAEATESFKTGIILSKQESKVDKTSSQMTQGSIQASRSSGQRSSQKPIRISKEELKSASQTPKKVIVSFTSSQQISENTEADTVVSQTTSESSVPTGGTSEDVQAAENSPGINTSQSDVVE